MAACSELIRLPAQGRPPCTAATAGFPPGSTRGIMMCLDGKCRKEFFQIGSGTLGAVGRFRAQGNNFFKNSTAIPASVLINRHGPSLKITKMSKHLMIIDPAQSCQNMPCLWVQTEVAGRLCPAFLLPAAHPSISVSGRTLGPQDERQAQARSHRRFEV